MNSGFLEGDYMKTGVYGPTHSTPEYTRTTQLFYDGEYISVYVWWYGEVDADRYPWWIIAADNMTDASYEPIDLFSFLFDGMC